MTLLLACDWLLETRMLSWQEECKKMPAGYVNLDFLNLKSFQEDLTSLRKISQFVPVSNDFCSILCCCYHISHLNLTRYTFTQEHIQRGRSLHLTSKLLSFRWHTFGWLAPNSLICV